MKNESLGNSSAIRERLAASLDVDIFAYEIADSTNRLAIEYATGDEWSGGPTVFIADGQTEGRGRLGRSFISPKGQGIYLSILIKRQDIGDGRNCDPVCITTYAAVVASRVIERLSGVRAEIKWVNDIYLGGKKVAGILTQGVIDRESGELSAAVMGIGINVLGDTLPDKIRDIATTIESEQSRLGLAAAPDRRAIAAAIISEFLEGLDLVGTPDVADEYRRRSFLIGREVTVITPTASYPATVTGIDDECHLLLRLPDGTASSLSTGEVSVRPLD